MIVADKISYSTYSDGNFKRGHIVYVCFVVCKQEVFILKKFHMRSFIRIRPICTVAPLGPGVNYFYFAFARYYLAFAKYYLAFAKYYLAFAKYYLAFAKYYFAFAKYYFAFAK